MEPTPYPHPQQSQRADRERASSWLAVWTQRLDIRCPVRLERTSIWHVTGENGRRGCSLVGVVLAPHEACIVHTRRLTQEDIVHELLHVAHPEWGEAAVILETARLLAQPQPGPRAVC